MADELGTGAGGEIGGGGGDDWDTDTAEDRRPPLCRNPVARGQYSIDTFYTASVNKHDHSEPMAVKVPASLNAIISAMIQSGRLPEYQTRQDLVRDAVTHRLQWLSEQTEVDGVEEWLKIEHALKQAENRKLRRESRDKVVERYREEVRAAVGGQDRVLVLDVMIDMDGVLEWLAEEPWHGQMVGLRGELEQALTRMG